MGRSNAVRRALLSRTGLRLWLTALVALSLCSEAVAGKRCRTARLNDKQLSAWFNPKPDKASDFLLPLAFDRGSVKPKPRSKLQPAMAFTPLRFVDSGLFPAKQSTYVMGADYPEPFENELQVRVASPTLDAKRRPKLYLGKYEVSKAQYALIAGRGNLHAGLEALRAVIKDPETAPLDAYFDRKSSCFGKISRKLWAYLATPVNFLPLDAYLQFLDRANEACFAHRPCRDALQAVARRAKRPAYLRLPLEHEWEFAARGGRSLLAGDLTLANVQTNLPPVEGGESFTAYAHINSDPARVLPIGSKRNLHGFHDLFGNAQELMQNRFTSENGFGAVGGAVARGGHFRTRLDDLRVSKRVELTPFRRAEKTGRFFEQAFPLTGIRLALGVPIRGAVDLRKAATTYRRFYVSLDEVGDGAGNRREDARDLGTVLSRSLNIRDELGGGDPTDVYVFRLDAYSKLDLRVVADDRATLLLLGAGGDVLARKTSRRGRLLKFDSIPLLPAQPYFIKIEPRSKKARQFKYEIEIVRKTIPDTGVAKPNAAALRYATAIGDRVTEFQGFVGQTDPADTYPVRMKSSKGGIRIAVTGNRSPLVLQLLDKGGAKVKDFEIAADNSADRAIRFPLARKQQAFVRIAPQSRRGRSAYSLVISPATIYDSVFSRSRRDLRPAKARRVYTGVLTTDVSRLFVAVDLRKPMELEAHLSGLESAVDMTIYDDAFRRLIGQQPRADKRDKIFKRALAKGRYIVGLELNGSQSSPFRFRFETAAKSTADLDPREVALSDVKHLEKPKFDFSSKLPKSGIGKYYSVKLSGGAKYYIRLTSLADVELDIIVEKKPGETYKSSVMIGREDFVPLSSKTDETVYIYVRQTNALRRDASFKIKMDKIPEGLSQITGNWTEFRARYDDWYVIESSNSCIAISAAETDTMLPYTIPRIRFIFNREEIGVFRHGISWDGSDKSKLKAEIQTRSKWKEFDIIRSGRTLNLFKHCDDGKSLCLSKTMRSFAKTGRKMRFSRADEKIVFSLAGARDALRDAAERCQNTWKSLWR